MKFVAPGVSMTPLPWELERAQDPVLRWTCADCHLPNAEHRDQWWACDGHWLACSEAS